MCQLCIEWQKRRITPKEAYRAIGEMLTTADSEKVKHLTNLSNEIIESEVPETKPNSAADQAWWNSTHPEDE